MARALSVAQVVSVFVVDWAIVKDNNSWVSVLQMGIMSCID